MKKVICLILALGLLFLAGCAKKEVGGLGSLIMDEKNNSASTGGIGALGKPGSSTDAPQVPDTPDTPAPHKEPTPTEPPVPPTPEPAVLETESYSCSYFTVTKPVGWEVGYKASTLDDGEKQMLIYIQDPQDPNNMFFYVRVLQPYFGSLEMKNRLLSLNLGDLRSLYEWSPVLDDISAESVLKQWAPSYTIMEMEGSLANTHFKNYRIEQVITTLDGGTSGNGVCTGVLAEVSIPGASSTYDMYLQNILTPCRIPNTTVDFYKGYDTFGFVASLDLFNNCFDVLNACKNSLSFSAGSFGFASTEDELPILDLGEIKID